jgi:predicted small lipoprotein YifL
LARHVDRPLARLALAGALVAALGLAGCGRKGPLDPPPGAAAEAPPTRTSGLPGSFRSAVPGRPAQTAQQAAVKPEEADAAGIDDHGNPIAGKGHRQHFFLDFLLY